MKIEKQFVRTYKACRMRIFIRKYIYIYVHVMSDRGICKSKCDIEKKKFQKNEKCSVKRERNVNLDGAYISMNMRKLSLNGQQPLR